MNDLSVKHRVMLAWQELCAAEQQCFGDSMTFHTVQPILLKLALASEPHQAPAGWQPSSALLVKLREQIEQSIIDARSLPMLGATSIAGHERERGRLAAYEEILSVLRADEILVEICPRCGERCPAGWCGACHKPTIGIRPARCTCGASVTGHPHIKDCPASLPPAPSLPEGQ